MNIIKTIKFSNFLFEHSVWPDNTTEERFFMPHNPQIRIVVGANWGDEGKGRMVDYFAQQADIVVRYQGGNNAGHTVINEFGEFKLHLLPSGVFNPAALNILGPGMVINLAGLLDELQSLQAQQIFPQVMVSDRATMVLPIHKLEDELEEQRLGNAAFGSTKNGIAYAYADRYAKKALQVGMLTNPDTLRTHLQRWYDWKIPMMKGLYGDFEHPDFHQLLTLLSAQAEQVAPLIGNVSRLSIAGKNLLLEAQLGSLRDLHFGNYPYTTSSSVLAAAAEVGSGLFWRTTPTVTAVVKSFSSSVGQGPFPTAMTDMTALRESALEYGATTGRARDIGHFDAVATRYGVALQKADEVALTKLDCLSGIDTLKICTHYELDGVTLSEYPMTEDLFHVTPVYRDLPGWTEDISTVREFAHLPQAAKNYVLTIEELIGTPIRYVSVGPERAQLINR